MVAYNAAELNYKEQEFCEETFNAFYDEYYKKIYNYIYFRIGSSFSAEDLTSIVLEKILKNIYRFDESKTSINTWIFTIVKNSLIDFYRFKGNQKVCLVDDMELVAIDMLTPGAEEVTLELERQKTIISLLEILSERERDVIALKFWGGLKSSEIAKQLTLEEGNVNIIVFRALKKLKKYIDEQNIDL